MRRTAGFALALAVLWTAVAGAAETRTAVVNVITDRTPGYLEPVARLYESQHGAKVNITYVDEGLIVRLKTKPDEADVLITKTSENLEIAKRQGLLQRFRSTAIAGNIPAAFRDRDSYYTELTYRARAIFYSKDRVKPDQLSTYEDLADRRWRGRICIRSGYHEYNLNLFGQMIATWGPERTRAFLAELKQNLARKPVGNDREQAKAIYQGKCDVALMNSYYMGIMQAKEEQRAWANACGVFFPNQQQGGSFVLTCGAALTTARRDTREATRFLEFLTSVPAQNHFAANTFEYPFNRAATVPAALKALGRDQKGIVGGAYAVKNVPISAVAGNRDAVIRLLDEVKFDQ